MGRGAWGDGLATLRGDVQLDCYFPRPTLGPIPSHVEPDAALGAAQADDPMRGVRSIVQRVGVTDLDAPPDSVSDGYLRLHLLSHRLVRPNEINLEGIFGILPNVAWTSLGPSCPSTSRTSSSEPKQLGSPWW